MSLLSTIKDESMAGAETTVLPVVTVIMPIRNEAKSIEKSLRSVLTQDYPAQRLEVLVIDGMSDDGTRDIVARIAQEEKTPRIRLLSNPARIVPTAFNVGLEHAIGEIIVRVDGHCTLDRDYVFQCVDCLRRTGAQNVGGSQRAVGNSWTGRAVALATSSPFGVGSAKFHYARKGQWVDTVYLGAWPRVVFERLGGFDEDLVRNQDDEFNFRVSQAGGKIWLDPKIRSTYICRGSFSTLWRQYFEYGKYKVLVAQKRGGFASIRHIVPASFVIAFAVSAGLFVKTGTTYWLIPVVVPYILANIMFSVREARREWLALPLLPLAFSILHFSYGLGFLSGIWRWGRFSRHG